MESSISARVHDARKELVAATGSGIGSALNDVLNSFLCWPFRAATGFATDSSGDKSDVFATIIGVTSHPGSTLQPIEISADALACVVDVYENMNVENLRVAYDRIARAKRLKKTPPPHELSVLHTAVTLGIVLAQDAAVPIETLAEELDRLNRVHPDREWTDMVVLLSKGTICYGVQFPGENSIGGYLPPAEGALPAIVPPMYVILVVQPASTFTFNKMCSVLFAHLTIFSPGSHLPDWTEILKGTRQQGMTLLGYQYNLSGQLLPVPRQYYNDRYLPPRPFRIEDDKGKLLSTLQFIPWQDGGVILLRGKLPLDGLMVFLGNKALQRAGIVKQPDSQISYVLPIKQADFLEMLERIQRQSNMVVRMDPTKLVVQKFLDEGSSSPFIARLFIGIARLRDTAFPDHAERQAFDQAHEFVVMTLLNTRTTSQEIFRMLAEHIRKVSQGEIARVRGQSIHIDENIDKELRKEFESFLNSAVRTFKQGMQGLTRVLQVDIGFLFQKPKVFEKGVTILEKSDPHLAAYLREVRMWSERLIDSRNAIEHEGWTLPKLKYSEASGAIHAAEPQILSQPVSEFMKFMMDRLNCFVEEVTVHCLQKRLPAGISVTETPLARRNAEVCERFKLTLTEGGKPIWTINYHTNTFEEN